MKPYERVVVGSGWMVYERDDVLHIEFRHMPDARTLGRLRTFMRWEPDIKAWTAPADPNTRRHLLVVANHAQTWESIGESPPSFWDPYDDL